jgi:hypothetical protein
MLKKKLKGRWCCVSKYSAWPLVGPLVENTVP